MEKNTEDSGKPTYEELQLLAIDQMRRLEKQAAELKEAHDIHTEFAKESDELEQIYQKQTSQLEETLESQMLQYKLLETNSAQMIMEIKIKMVEMKRAGDTEVSSLKDLTYLLKKRVIDLGGNLDDLQEKESQLSKKREQDKQNTEKQLQIQQEQGDDLEQVNKQLELELNQRNSLLDELTQDLEKAKESLKSQSQLFQTFTTDMNIKNDQQQQQIDVHSKSSKNQLDELYKIIDKKDEIIESLEQLNQESNSESESVRQLKEIVILQSEKLKLLSVEFQDYQTSSDQQFENQEKLKQLEIAHLKKKLEIYKKASSEKVD